jgi:hypothetical protein
MIKHRTRRDKNNHKREEMLILSSATLWEGREENNNLKGSTMA